MSRCLKSCIMLVAEQELISQDNFPVGLVHVTSH
jgi:hypothetical protein